METLPNYDDWKLASPPEMEIDAELERLEQLAGRVAEVESDGNGRYYIWLRGALHVDDAIEILELRHRQVRN